MVSIAFFQLQGDREIVKFNQRHAGKCSCLSLSGGRFLTKPRTTYRLCNCSTAFGSHRLSLSISLLVAEPTGGDGTCRPSNVLWCFPRSRRGCMTTVNRCHIGPILHNVVVEPWRCLSSECPGVHGACRIRAGIRHLDVLILACKFNLG